MAGVRRNDGAFAAEQGELTVLQVVRLKSALDIGQLNHAEVTVFLKWRIGMAVQGLAEHHALRHPRPAQVDGAPVGALDII